MASKYFSLDEVMERLDESDFDESEDDFDGYLENDECGLEDEQVLEENEDGMPSVGAEVVIGGLTVPDYALDAGCCVPMESKSPLDFFSLLLTDSILENIVTQTNLSAQQFIEAHELPPHSRVRRWSKSVHNIDELRQFLAIVIIMGLVRYPQIEHHWTTQWPYSNTHFSSVSLWIK